MQIDQIFAALASSPRRQILACLAEAELTTSDLAERFSVSAPTISRHLSVLENAGLVTSERCGQYVLYRLNRDQLADALSSYAGELCQTAGPRNRRKRRRTTQVAGR